MDCGHRLIYSVTNRYRVDKTQLTAAVHDGGMRLQTPPIPRGTAHHFKHPAGFLVPVVDLNRCEGKGPCVDVCPVDVFEMDVMTPQQRAGLSAGGHGQGFCAPVEAGASHQPRRLQGLRPVCQGLP